MIDRQRVITALECCKDVHQSGCWASGCISCDYANKHKPDCFLSLANDAIVLLKEQQEIVRCKDCKERGTYQCPIYVGGDGMCGSPDEWFCADGTKGGEAK